MLTRDANAFRATDIIGAGVRNYQNEDLGKIEDFVIDTEDGRIGYAVLSFGGILGIGDKLFAVPFQSLNWDSERGEFVMQANKERMKNAPGFDANDWPKIGDRKWGSTIHQYYGVKPYWE
jgi:sporulation protein YlmC with PRC-barrel domain